jgi:putative redox protein
VVGGYDRACMSSKTVDVTYKGGMRFEAVLGSGHRVTFDDVAGGPDPGPVEAVLAALVACTAMDVISIALKKRQDVVRYTIHGDSSQSDDYPKVFTRIDIVHEVEGADVDTRAIQQCIELSARKYCPISNMLSAGPTEIHHRYRVVRPGEPADEGEVIVTGPDSPLEVVS